MSDTYVYRFEGNLYINLTNKCSNACTFCLRNNGDGIGGHTLWLTKEPTASEVISELERNLATASVTQVVFCGYGESTYRLNELLEIATYLKSKGQKTRLDTNGHGNYINGCDITDKLCGLIDTVSISLNHSSENGYNKISVPNFSGAFDEVIGFASKCVQKGIETILTVVDILPKQDIEKCQKIADSIGARLRVREYIP